MKKLKIGKLGISPKIGKKLENWKIGKLEISRKLKISRHFRFESVATRPVTIPTKFINRNSINFTNSVNSGIIQIRIPSIDQFQFQFKLKKLEKIENFTKIGKYWKLENSQKLEISPKLENWKKLKIGKKLEKIGKFTKNGNFTKIGHFIQIGNVTKIVKILQIRIPSIQIQFQFRIEWQLKSIQSPLKFQLKKQKKAKRKEKKAADHKTIRYPSEASAQSAIHPP